MARIRVALRRAIFKLIARHKAGNEPKKGAGASVAETPGNPGYRLRLLFRQRSLQARFDLFAPTDTPSRAMAVG